MTDKEKSDQLVDLTSNTARNGLGDVEAVSEVLDSMLVDDEELTQDTTENILNSVSNLVQSDLKVADDEVETASDISDK